MEDDVALADAIYGDLENFEFDEKLKEKNDEIASLTQRLNQSIVTITDQQIEIKNLKNENRQVKKNTSSLLLTAKVEVNRKQREITSLQQKLDNKIFRRPNSFSVAIQTDVTIDPFFVSRPNKNKEQIQHQQSIIDRCTQNINVTSEKSNTCNNTRHALNNYHIPKKNSFARHVNMNEATNTISVCNTEKLKEAKIVANDQSKSYHMPKKNPFARRVDVDEQKAKVNRDSPSARIENDGEKTKSKSRRDDLKDDRKRSPTTHNSNSKHDNKKSSNCDDQRRRGHNISQKHSRGRDSNDERDRHSKRFRSDSKSSHYRSRSKSRRNEEKHRQPNSPEKSNSKSRKDDVIEGEGVSKDSISDMKEIELEAMLMAQRKVLEEIDNRDKKGQKEIKENTSKKRQKRKISSNDVAEKVNNDERSEDLVNSANDVISNVQLSNASVPVTDFISDLGQKTMVDPKKLEPLLVVPSNVKLQLPLMETVPSVLERDLNLEVASVETASTTNLKSLPHEEFLSPDKTSSDLIMDCPIVNKDNIADSLSANINASVIAIENNEPNEKSGGENNLSNSFEHHILPHCEYTVQDTGDEIVMYITKKRKKNKNVKVNS